MTLTIVRKKQKITHHIKVAAYALVCLILVATTPAIITNFSSPALASTESELRAEVAQIEAELKASKNKLADIHDHVSTLESKVDELNLEVSIVQQEIQLINSKIKQLTQQIEEKEAELEHQQEILSESLRQLYKRGDITTIELLASTGSYSEFINEQEYLSRLKGAIQESVTSIQELKAQLEKENEKQQDLLAQQEGQRKILASKRAEQQRLLDETKGEEARFENYVADLQERKAEADAALLRFIVSQSGYGGNGAGMVVQPGEYVNAGQHIGYVGSTGLSTGPHLHFVYIVNGQRVEPMANYGGPTLKDGMKWPVPNHFGVSTRFGNIHCSQYTGCYPPGSNYSVFHSGVDIPAPFGTPVVAAKGGVVTWSGYYDGGFGYMVIVQHSDGTITYYPHLNP